jgi:hypothetical protein
MSESKKTTPFEKYKRNEHGLLDGVNYEFNEDGSINWRAMIKPEFLYPNKDWFEGRRQQAPNSIEGLNDKQLLIMLGGIKELAKLRGFNNVSYTISHISEDYVVAKCQISWIGNYETDDRAIIFEDVANATANNTDDFCIKFLETIACNRAFVRCVRNFLNIHIVGADEIDKSKNRVIDLGDMLVSTAIPVTPQGALEKAVNEKLKINSFDGFKEHLRVLWTSEAYRNQEAKNWESFKDIPAKESRILLKIVNS